MAAQEVSLFGRLSFFERRTDKLLSLPHTAFQGDFFGPYQPAPDAGLLERAGVDQWARVGRIIDAAVSCIAPQIPSSKFTPTENVISAIQLAIFVEEQAHAAQRIFSGHAEYAPYASIAGAVIPAAFDVLIHSYLSITTRIVYEKNQET